MARWQYIFFDVGNTLLFPNREVMLEPLPPAQRPTLDEWQALERLTKHEFDASLLEGSPDHGFWWSFHTRLLTDRSLPLDGVRDAVVRNTQNSANWDQILPGTRDALARISQRYKIAVISNADGRIHEVLAPAALRIVFKPSPTPASSGTRNRILRFSRRRCAAWMHGPNRVSTSATCIRWTTWARRMQAWTPC